MVCKRETKGKTEIIKEVGVDKFLLAKGWQNTAAKRLRMRKFVAVIRAFVVMP